jgi:hypothetical protein
VSGAPAKQPAATAGEPSAYRALVGLFWTLSMREPPGYLARQGGAKSVRRSTGWWIYALYGLILLPAAVLGMEAGAYAFYVTAAAFLIVGMAVTADFAGVIVAPGEDEILFHLPLRPRAYLAARVTVALLHTGLLAACFALLPVAFGIARYGGLAYGGLLALAVLLTAAFSLILSFVLYRLALRLLGGRRLRDLLAWLPPLIGLLFAFAPQVLLRATGGGRVPSLPAEVLLVLPPGWFAALPEAVLGDPDASVRTRAFLGVGALVVSGTVLVWALGRGLLADLQRLLASGEGSGPATSAERAGRLAPGRWAMRVAPLADGDAQAGYLLATGALRLREMRVRMASSLLMPFLILVLSTTGPRDTWYPGFAAVLLGMTTGTLLTLAVHHEHHAASWFYGALPVRQYGRFVGGVLAAMTLRYVLPAFLLLVGVGLVMSRDPWTPVTMLYGVLAGALEIPIVARALRHAPFSLPPGPGAHKGLMLTLIASLLLSGFVFGIGLAVSYFSKWLLLAVIPLLALWLSALLRGALARLDRSPPWERPGYGG